MNLYSLSEPGERTMCFEAECNECYTIAEVDCEALILDYDIVAKWKCPDCGTVKELSRSWDGSAIDGDW